MSTPQPQGIAVLLGPARSRWPEPLATALEFGDFYLQRVDSVHEAAAFLASLRSQHPVLILDPDLLSRSDINLLRIVKRRLDLPMILLPLTRAASPASRHAAEFALNWEDAHQVFMKPSHSPQIQQPQSPPGTDNDKPAPAETLLENSVTSAIDPRYDEQQAVLTDEELRALLGTLD